MVETLANTGLGRTFDRSEIRPSSRYEMVDRHLRCGSTQGLPIVVRPSHQR